MYAAHRVFLVVTCAALILTGVTAAPADGPAAPPAHSAALRPPPPPPHPSPPSRLPAESVFPPP